MSFLTNRTAGHAVWPAGRITHRLGRAVLVLITLAAVITVSVPGRAVAWNDGWDSPGCESAYGSSYWWGGHATAQRFGNFTFYNAPGISVTAHRLGNFTFYDGYNYNTDRFISGTAQRIGNYTFFDWR